MSWWMRAKWTEQVLVIQPSNIQVQLLAGEAICRKNNTLSQQEEQCVKADTVVSEKWTSEIPIYPKSGCLGVQISDKKVKQKKPTPL